MEPAASETGEGWTRRLLHRMRTYPLAKHSAICVLMTLFFVGYFATQNHPVFTPFTVPLTPVDRAIAFSPRWVVFYASLWFYVPMVSVMIGDRRELLRYAISVIALGALGIGFFALWPTSTPAQPIDWSGAPYFGFLKAVDKAGNACPSLHVTFAVLTAVAAHRVLREVGAPRWVQVANLLWALGIVYSTLATKQHVLIDVLCGTLLGSVWSVGHLRWVRPARSVFAEASVAGMPATASATPPPEPATV